MKWAICVSHFRPLLYQDNIVITVSSLPTDAIIEVRSLSCCHVEVGPDAVSI